MNGGQVQRQLAPHQPLMIPGYDVAGVSFASVGVSGDFFDLYPVPDGLHVALADVMGKGVAAALLGAGVRATLRGGAYFHVVVGAVNRSAAALKDDLAATGSFATMFSARLDPARHTLGYVDAGHGLAVHIRGQQRRQLACDGLPLGVLPGQTWHGHELDLAPGDTVVVVSDGVLDVYGTPEAAGEAASLAAQSGSAAEIVAAVGDLARSQLVTDDITVVVVRRTR